MTAVTSVPPFLPVATPDGSSVLVTLFERCVNGDVRLVGGDNTLEGRVQMCFNGVFGFVCDTDGWTQEEADVVCTQLGNIAIPGEFSECRSYQGWWEHWEGHNAVHNLCS